VASLLVVMIGYQQDSPLRPCPRGVSWTGSL